MVDVNKLLGQLLNSSQGKSLAGGLLVGGLAGALTGKAGQKVATTALKFGGVAAIAGLAYKAFQTYQLQQRSNGLGQIPDASGHRTGTGPRPSPPRTLDQRADDVADILPPPDSGYLPRTEDAPANDALALKLVRAMIAAAKADGRIDPQESRKIMGQVGALGFSDDEKALLLSEITHPLPVRDIAASAATPTEAEEIFAVSVMAVDPKGDAERGYLTELGRLLGLDPNLARAIHDRVAEAG